MREPFEGQPFDAIFNLFTSFGYFEDDADNLKTLSPSAKAFRNTDSPSSIL